MVSKGKCMQLWNWETSQWGTGKRKRWENKGEDETLFNDILKKKKKETFCLLRGTVLWEKRKHSYYSSSNHLLYYYILWDCFQVSCFPGSKPWAEPPWCVGMFWQAWALPGELSLDPLGSKGCAPQPLAAGRELVVQGVPNQAVGHTVDMSTLRSSPQHPAYTETERVLGSPLFIDSISGQRIMGWFSMSVSFSDRRGC